MKHPNNQTIGTIHFESLYPVTTRFAETEHMLRYIKEGKSVQVLSLPGGGRSNFLGLLAYNKALRQHHLNDDHIWYHFVPVDFSQIRKKPLSDSYKLIFLELIESLQDRGLLEEYATVKQLLKDALELQDELVLFQGLKKAIAYICLEKKLTVVLLFDRFEEYIPMLTADFFTNLRTLRNLAKYRFSVVFSLPKPLEYTLEPLLFSDFSEFVKDNTIYLPLCDESSLQFRISYMEKLAGKTISESTKETIFSLTGGHAKLTRICADVALQNTFDTTTVFSQNGVQEVLQEIWSICNPAEKTHFIKDLFSSEYEDEHTKYLRAIGIVKDQTITIPLFKEFVEQQKNELQTKPSENLRFASDSNTILQKDTDISANFTATEFRLLKFFLQNPNTVLERNVIIQGVWQDTKTVLGVTDQALDQLIFRLRRKIEEDPNHPTHLQTIKGRGFTFTP